MSLDRVETMAWTVWSATSEVLIEPSDNELEVLEQEAFEQGKAHG